MHIHCHRCGGFIASPGGTTYRAPSGATPVATPHSALCRCDHPLIYGHPPERERQLRGVHHIRSASRN